MMQNVDLFIYYDQVQYDKNGWRNRNRVIANGRPKWLTLSVSKSRLSQDLSDRDLRNVRLIDQNQFREHRRLLELYYKGSTHIALLDQIYPNSLSESIFLCENTIAHTELIATLLNIKSERKIASCLNQHQHTDHAVYKTQLDRKNGRLLKLLKSVGCTEYISGLAASSYLDLELFKANGISVEWNKFKSHDESLSVLHYLLVNGVCGVVESLSF
jgi:hypothetical protein